MLAAYGAPDKLDADDGAIHEYGYFTADRTKKREAEFLMGRGFIVKFSCKQED